MGDQGAVMGGLWADLVLEEGHDGEVEREQLLGLPHQRQPLGVAAALRLPHALEVLRGTAGAKQHHYG